MINKSNTRSQNTTQNYNYTIKLQYRATMDSMLSRQVVFKVDFWHLTPNKKKEWSLKSELGCLIDIVQSRFFIFSVNSSGIIKNRLDGAALIVKGQIIFPYRSGNTGENRFLSSILVVFCIIIVCATRTRAVKMRHQIVHVPTSCDKTRRPSVWFNNLEDQ